MTVASGEINLQSKHDRIWHVAKVKAATSAHSKADVIPFFRKNENTAYFRINSLLEASNWSQITFCILTNVLTSTSERFCPNFEQINISSRVTAITVACILN